MSKIIRVLLADDHELVRAGIRILLEKLPDFEIVAEAGDGQEAIRLSEELKPDVVITDIGMPIASGFELAQHLTETAPNIRVLILSMYADDLHARKALRSGATGYLLKDAAPEELALAIRAVAGGESYVSPRVLTQLLANQDREDPQPGPLARLTTRQVEILKLIAQGKTTKQIALDLNISVKTVESHRTLLMDRLEIHEVASLVRFAVKVGLVTVED